MPPLQQCTYNLKIVSSSGSCLKTHMLHRKDDADAIFVDNDTRIQILETMSWLPRADREQCGAFIVSSD